MSTSLWGQVLDRIRRKVNSHSYNTWFKPTQIQSVAGRTLSVKVPNPLFAEWLRNNYMPLISQTVQEIDGQSWDIVFSCPGEEPRRGEQTAAKKGTAPSPEIAAPARVEIPEPAPHAASINPRYTIE